jgi:acyl-coenzyme A synthetase/AMP-(fatty) acid ligase
MVDGWLRTGDTFLRDDDGYYVYRGRNDDMLKVGGIWCSPIEIEARLGEHPEVLEAAVVGRADANGLVKPEAWVVLKQECTDLAGMQRELVLHCKAKLAAYKYPRWFHFVPEWPKTAIGKIQRFRLRAVAGNAVRDREVQAARGGRRDGVSEEGHAEGLPGGMGQAT